MEDNTNKDTTFWEDSNIKKEYSNGKDGRSIHIIIPEHYCKVDFYHVPSINWEGKYEHFDMVNGAFTMTANVTAYQHENKFHELAVSDYMMTEEDDTFNPITIDFEDVVMDNVRSQDFKHFFRRENRHFIMKTNRNNIVRYVLFEKTTESVEDIYSGFMHDHHFSIRTLTHWIEIEKVVFELKNDTIYRGYAGTLRKDPTTGVITPLNEGKENAYIYNTRYIYGRTYDTIDYFKVNLPENDGDKKMYLDFVISNADSNPCWGLRKRYDQIFEAYQAEGITINSSGLMFHNSFPPLKEITIQSSLNDTFNVENLRNYEKKTYLSVPPGEKTKIIFTNVRKGAIWCYKQFVLPF